MGCGEPAGEGQLGWGGAPAAAPALEEPRRLVLSTPSSVLWDREIQEVRNLPSSMGTPPFTPIFPTPQSHGRSSVRPEG